MTNEYLAYIQSEEWKQKREQRLAISRHQCAVCGKRTKPMHVHHLTYARLFKEEMSDLLPLCELHHNTAEELKRIGKLPRDGHTLFLATETVRLILSRETPQPARHPKRKKSSSRVTIVQPLREAIRFTTEKRPLSYFFPSAPVLVTEEFLRNLKSKRGGFTRKNLTALGVEWPPRRGWKKRLIGKMINPDGLAPSG